MLIGGVAILTQPDKTESILDTLQEIQGITTYGIHKEYHIVTVLESDSLKGLEELTDQIGKNIPGVLGVYPAYVNFEDESEN